MSSVEPIVGEGVMSPMETVAEDLIIFPEDPVVMEAVVSPEDTTGMGCPLSQKEPVVVMDPDPDHEQLDTETLSIFLAEHVNALASVFKPLDFVARLYKNFSSRTRVIEENVCFIKKVIKNKQLLSF